MSAADDQRAAEHCRDADWTSVPCEPVCRRCGRDLPDGSEVDRLRAELAETRAALAAQIDAKAVLVIAGDALAGAAGAAAVGAVEWVSAVSDLAAARDGWRSVRGAAPAPAEPPAVELPVTLSSVDDFRKVCEQAGLTTHPNDHVWASRLCNVIVGWEVHPGCAQLYRYDTGEHYATFFAGATDVELVAAIEAARGGSR